MLVMKFTPEAVGEHVLWAHWQAGLGHGAEPSVGAQEVLGVLAVAALRTHRLGPRRERKAAAHHEEEAQGAGSLPSPPALRAAAGSSSWPAGSVSPSAFPLAWPESLNGLFRTSQCCPAPPPPFVRWLARVSAGGLCRAKSGGAGRSASSGCYLLHFCRKLFLRVRVGVGVGETRGRGADLSFCLQLESGELDSLAQFSLPSGFPSCRQEPFQELLRARLSCLSPGGLAPAARVSSLRVRER